MTGVGLSVIQGALSKYPHSTFAEGRLRGLDDRSAAATLGRICTHPLIAEPPRANLFNGIGPNSDISTFSRCRGGLMGVQIAVARWLFGHDPK